MGAELLAYRDATALAAALVGRSAAEGGIRALLIKGYSLELHGLREERASADVDVLVEPGRSGDLVEALRSRGWVARRMSFGDARMTTHSMTLVRSQWPIDIDVHNEYLGLLAGPGRAFEVLWRARVQAVMAAVPVWIPDRSSSVVLWALHSLRGTDLQERHRLELDKLVTSVLPSLGPSDVAELAERVVELGADRPLREVPAFARIIGEHCSLAEERSVFSWDRKMAQAHEATQWLQVIREAPRREWPVVLARAVWPSRRDLQLIVPDLVDTPGGRTRARASRVSRFWTRLWSRPDQRH